MDSLDSTCLDQLFRTARSRNRWRAETLPDSTWRDLYDLVKFAPTSANCSPARFVFVTTPEAKDKLAPCLSAANRGKTLEAPAIAIIAYDLDFAQRMPDLFPHNPAASAWFAKTDVAEATAFRNGSLQGAFLMLAARARGLEAGPMSGFDHAKLDRTFFEGTNIKSNFICALGHGVDEPFPRLPRLPFDDACKIV